MKVLTSLSIVFLCTVLTLSADNYFWVGGSGNWSDLTHWATTSGGTTNPTVVPQSTDDVFFDANSGFSAGDNTVTIDETIIFCQNMDWTGATASPVFDGSGSNMLFIYGSMTLIPDLNLSFSGEIHFLAFMPNNQITLAGQTLSNTVYFEGSGGEWTFLDAFSANQVRHDDGKIISNNQTITVGNWDASGFPVLGELELGTSEVIIPFGSSASMYYDIGKLDADQSHFIFQNGGNLQGNNHDYFNVSFLNLNNFDNWGNINEGNVLGKLLFGYNGRINAFSNKSINEVEFQDNGEIYGQNNFNTITFAPGKIYEIGGFSTQTLNTGGVINMSSTDCDDFITIKSNNPGQPATIQATDNQTGNFLTIMDIHVTGGATFTVMNSVDLGNNVGWQIMPPQSRNLYWIGGDGDWNDKDNWSLTSGGTGGECIPTAFDNVFFDTNSGLTNGSVVNLNGILSYCNDMDWTGTVDGVVLDGDSGDRDLLIYGSVILPTGLNWSFVGTTRFQATSIGETITSNGVEFSNVTYFEGSGGEWTFLDAFSANQVRHDDGKIISNNQTITVGNWDASGFPVLGELELGTSEVIIPFGSSASMYYDIGKLDADQSHFIFQNGGNLQGNNHDYFNVSFLNLNNFDNWGNINEGNVLGKLLFGYNGRINAFSNKSINEVEFQDNGEIYGQNNFNTIIFAPGKIYEIGGFSTQTLNAGGAINMSSTDCDDFITIKSNNPGQPATIQATDNQTGNFLTIMDIHVTGGAIFTAMNSVDLGNNVGWTIMPPSSRNLYWVGGNGDWNDKDNWSLTSGGTGGECIPTAFDNVFFDTNSGLTNGSVVNLNGILSYCNDMDWTGTVDGVVLDGDSGDRDLLIYGSVILPTGLNWSFVGTTRFRATSIGETITSNGVEFSNVTYFEGSGGEWTFLDAFSANQVRHDDGKIISNNQTITVGNWDASGFPVLGELELGTSEVIIPFGSSASMYYDIGKLDADQSHFIFQNGGNLQGNNHDYFNVSFLNLNNFDNWGNINEGNVLGKLLFGYNGRINAFSNKSINEVEFQDNGEIYGQNNFNIITFAPGKTYIIQAGSIQTISPLGIFNAMGNGSFPIELKSNSLGTQATIQKDGDPVCLDFLFLTDINATGTGFAYAGANSDDVNNNDGFIFAACPACFTAPPAAPPVLDNNLSDLTVSQGEMVTLVVQNVPVDNEIVWFDEDQVTELYANTANNFQTTLNATGFYYGAFRDVNTGCLSELLAVQACAIPALSVEVIFTASNCPTPGTGTVRAIPQGGAQAQGNNRFAAREEPEIFEFLDLAKEGDLDGDGDLDFISGGYPSFQNVYLNNGDGTFSNNFQIQFPLLGGSPAAFDIGDLDGDGDLDLFTTDNNNLLTVFFNDGNANFTQGSTFHFGRQKFSINLGDLDNDGDLDAFVLGHGGDSSTPEIRIWLNDSNGVFTEGPEILVAGGIGRADLADLDNDGDLDAFLTHNGVSEVWLNDGDATFTQSAETYLSSEFGSYVDLGDLDGDGDVDAFVSINANPSKVLLNDGDGTFTESLETYGDNTTGAGEIQLFDITQDGILDAVLGQAGNSSSFVLEGDGDGTFTLLEDLSTVTPIVNYAASGKGVIVGDFDQDCDIDVGLGNALGRGIIYFNNQELQTPYTFQWDDPANSTTAMLTNLLPGTYTVTVTDLDGNIVSETVIIESVPDLTLNATPQNETCAAANDGQITATAGGGAPYAFRLNGQDFTENTIYSSVEPGDFNNDGNLDIFVTGFFNADRPDFVYFGAGDGTFTKGAEEYEITGYATNLGQVGDLDNDGDLDMMVAANPAVGVYLNDGDGTFTNGEDYLVATGGIVSQFWNGMDLGDLNGDGFLDVVIGSDGYRGYAVLVNDGDGTFTQTYVQYGAERISQIDLADVDNDGDLDFFATGSFTNNVIYYNDGTGVFTQGSEAYGDNYFWRDAELFDFNYDGFVDVFVTNQEGKPNLVLINDGDGTFTETQSAFGENGLQVHFADYDSDGFTDAWVQTFSAGFKIYRNDGTGVFSEYPPDHSLFGGYVDMNIGDFDNDGDMDVVTGHVNRMTVLINGENEYTFKINNVPFGNTTIAGQPTTATDLDAGTYNIMVTDSYNCSTMTTATVGTNGTNPPPPLMLSTFVNAVSCNDGNNGIAEVFATGGAQSKGTGNFIVSDENPGSNGVFVSTGDLDADGDLDAYITQTSGNPDEVWLNDGTGDFTKLNEYYLETVGSNSSAMGDLDADGDLDVFISELQGKNRVLFNDGDGTFTVGTDVFIASNVTVSNANAQINTHVALADLDGDNDLDAFVTTAFNQPNHVWLNNGDGTFTEVLENYGTSYSTRADLADLDGDGDMDAFVTNINGQPNTVWLNDGDGTFTASVEDYGTSNSFDVKLLDFDMDGDTDAYVANNNGQPNRVWLNDGDGTFTESPENYGNNFSSGLALADVNCDGKKDIFDGHKVYLNDGDGTFTPTPQTYNGSRHLSMGDFDADGDIDAFLVYSNLGPIFSNVILLNDDSEVTPYVYQWDAAAGNQTSSRLTNLEAGTYMVTVTDADGAQATTSVTVIEPPAIVVNTSSTNTTCATTSDGSATATASGGQEIQFKILEETYVTPGNPLDVELADLDGDGDTDAFVAAGIGSPGGNMRVFLNDGDGTFTIVNENYVNGTGLVLGDLDNDGDVDAFVIGSNPFVYYNDGDGTFTAGTEVYYMPPSTPPGVGVSTNDATLGDFNGDGFLDVFTANNILYSSNEVWLNDGDGTFTLMPERYGFRNTNDVETADFNGDNILDVFAANSGAPNTVHFGNGDGTFTLSNEEYGEFNSQDVEIGDLDNDGDIDVFVVSSFPEEPNKVWLNDGDGTFSEVPEVYGFNGGGLALGDINSDGFLDAFIVFGSSSADFAKIWINDGDGTFSEVPYLFQPSGNMHDVELADFNNDGTPDAFLAAVFDKPVWHNLDNCFTYLWDANANNQTTETATNLASGSYTVTVTDNSNCTQTATVVVGNDNIMPTITAASNAPFCEGTVDLMLTESGGAATSWSWTSTTGFTSNDQNPIIQNPTAADSGDYTVEITDANGCTNSQTITVTIQPAVSTSLTENEIITERGSVISLTIPNVQAGQEAVWFDEDQTTELYADVANDFQPTVENAQVYYGAVRDLNTGCVSELVAVNVLAYYPLEITVEAYAARCSYDSNGSAQALVNGGRQSIGTGHFKESTERYGFTSFRAILEDFNGDSYLDIYASGYNKPDAVWLNDGDGTFTYQSVDYNSINAGVWAVSEDFDNDGDKDIYVCNATINNLSADKVLINDGTGGFSELPQSYGLGTSQGAAVGDINSDGNIDIIVTGSGFVVAYLGNGDGTFNQQSNFGGPYAGRDVELGDLDGDGNLDVFVFNGAGLGSTVNPPNPNKVYLNDGNGTFSEVAEDYGTNEASWDGELGDLDGDGDLDAIVANWNGFDDKIFLNDGDGTFTESAQAFSPNFWTRGAELGDVDRDGDLDIIFAHFNYFTGTGSASVRQWFNDGLGNFIESTTVYPEATDVAIGDIDRDGDLDVFSCNRYPAPYSGLLMLPQ